MDDSEHQNSSGEVPAAELSQIVENLTVQALREVKT